MSIFKQILSPTGLRWLAALFVLFVLFYWLGFQALLVLYAFIASLFVFIETLVPAVQRKRWSETKKWLDDNQTKLAYFTGLVAPWAIALALFFVFINDKSWYPIGLMLPCVFHSHALIRHIQGWVYPKYKGK
mgnify:CR=1 FL=1